MCVPQAAERIRHYVPNAKLIAVLRDPVDRAYSAYRHLVRDGRETLSFEEGLAAEPSRTAANWRPGYYYKQLGFYYAQLRRYFALFSREQIAVYTYESSRLTPGPVEGDVCLSGCRPRLPAGHVGAAQRLGYPEIPSPPRDLRPAQQGQGPGERLLPARAQRLYGALMSRNIKVSEPKIARHTEQALREEYREDLLQLESLLGRDRSAWRTGRQP